MAVTIKEVAKLANVSISTASYALNGKPNVSDKLRERVLEAAKQLNYHPNAAARHLKSKKTMSIGVFIYGFSGPVFSEILEGMNQAALEEGYNLIVSSGALSDKIINQRQIDGAIIFDSSIEDEVLINFAKANYPVILLDRDLSGKNIYRSVINNEEIVYQFINELADKYGSVGILTGPRDSYNALRRITGYEKAIKNKGLKSYIYEGDFTYKRGLEVGAEIANTKLPRAIFCSNDESAIGLMGALMERGYRIPEDIAIAGFDNIMWTKYVIPKLTTIEIDHTAWGHDVAKSLINNLQEGTFLNIDEPKYQMVYRTSA